MHPIHNLAVIQYDPNDPKLRDVEVKSARLKPVSAAGVAGNRAWLVGVAPLPTGVHRVACHQGRLDEGNIAFPLTTPPRFMEQNLDLVHIQPSDGPVPDRQVCVSSLCLSGPGPCWRWEAGSGLFVRAY